MYVKNEHFYYRTAYHSEGLNSPSRGALAKSDKKFYFTNMPTELRIDFRN